MKRQRMISWLIIFSLIITMISFNPQVALAAASSGNVLGGQQTAGCLRVTVANGDIDVERYNGSSFVSQYYDPADAILDVNGSLYSLGTYFKSWYDETDSVSSITVKTQTGDSQSIVTTWETSTLQITQTVTLPSLTAQYIKLQWDIKNIGSDTLSNLHFLRGEDTFLAGGDNGAGYWDSATNSVGVSKVVSGITQRLYLMGITVPNSYISANYYTMGMDVVNGGELSKYIDSNESTDNGYALEWNWASLNSNSTWTIKAIESFVSSSVTATGSSAYVDSATGGAITLSYTVTNSSTTTQAVTYSVTKPEGWTAIPDKTTDSLAAGATTTVKVEVVPPLNAINGVYDVILNIISAGAEAQSIGSVTLNRSVEAPYVIADDYNDLLIGADNTMEFSVDGGTTWIPYDSSNVPSFAGNQTVLVRVKASADSAAGDITTVQFTYAAPVVGNDLNNVLVGVDNTYEYSPDGGATWIPYSSDNAPAFSGGTTVLVRKSAGELVAINYAVDSVTGSAINVISGSALSVTGSAVTVAADFNNNKLIGVINTMEYSTDNGLTWNDCGSVSELTFTDDAIVLLRIKAGEIETVNFTENPVLPSAPIVSAEDIYNHIIGADNTMEYSVDNGTTWTAYDSSNIPTFDGNKTVNIRIQAGEAVAIDYASGSIIGSAIHVVSGSAVSVTGSAVTVAADFTNHKLTGVYDTMEYSLDNGVTWFDCGSNGEVIFSSDATVLLRQKAGYIATVYFTINPPLAPAVIADDYNNLLVGADSTMEYSYNNGATWISYNPDYPPHFGDNDTILIRVKANGITPAGYITTAIFTKNQVSQTTEDTSGVKTGDKTDDAATDNSVRQVDVSLEDESGASKATTLDIVRTNEDNVAIDTVTLDEEKTIEALKDTKASGNTVSIYVNDDQENPADEVKVNVTIDSLLQLSDAESNLEIKTDDVTISLSKDSIQNLAQQGEDLYFRVVPIKDENSKKAAIDSTMQSAEVKLYAQYKDIEIYGTPMTIETNYKDQDTVVTFSLDGINLPEDADLRAKVLANLAVYVQHSDGEKEIIPGTIVYDSNGKPVGVQITIHKFSTFTLISTTNTAPTVSDLKITGTAEVGKTIKATYTYSDADNDAEGKTQYQWYRANNKAGNNKTKIASATKSSYTVTEKDQGKYLICVITPVSKAGVSKGKSSSVAAYVKAVKAASNAAPEISKAYITGQPSLGSKLTVKYTYSDAEKDKEAAPVIKWYRSDVNGSNKELIKGADGLTYTLMKKDIGKYISCEVTVKAKTGTGNGKTAAVTTKSAVKDNKVKYTAQVKLGLIGSEKYANQVADIFKNTYQAGNVTVVKEGSYYRVTASFTSKSAAAKACKEMKEAQYIINYYISNIK